MGMLDMFTGGAGGDMEQGYEDAKGYLGPYQQGGVQDYNSYRNYVSQYGQNLSPYQNSGNYQYSQINQSPTDYYNNIMSGYSESPDAKYQQEQSNKASSFGASASGMTGSGAFYKGLQQNANDIAMNDRNNYYNNVMGANNAQMGALQNYQNQQMQYSQMQQYLTSLGYNSANSLAGYGMQNGMNQGKNDSSGLGNLAGLAGTAIGWYFGGPAGGAAGGAAGNAIAGN